MNSRARRQKDARRQSYFRYRSLKLDLVVQRQADCSLRRRRFHAGIRGLSKASLQRLEILGAATGLEDLRTLPSNRLEALKGDRLGQYSIRVNQQWRLCFEWPPGALGPRNVEIVNYH